MYVMRNILLSFLLLFMFTPFIVNAETCNTDKISISSITIENKTDNVNEIDGATVDGKKINLNLRMSEVGDIIKYKMIVKNDSNEDYKIDKNSLNVNSSYINYSLNSDDNSDIIKANSTKTFFLKVDYKIEVPEDGYESESFIDNKNISIQLITNSKINVPKILNNPKTLNSFINVIIILFIISALSLLIIKNRKKETIVVLIIGAVIIPISTYALCKSNIVIESTIRIDKPIECGSFETDNWKTITTNVKNGNDDCYHIGDTKEVDMGDFGTHTLRISNKSTPSECNQTGFSQTACGFVLEFADIITTHRMNPWNNGETNGDGSKGGWLASEMRTYVNSDIYNALPTKLKSAIINTTVVSGHGPFDSSNFTSIDKLYLLSTHEVWEDDDGRTNRGIDYLDTAYSNTRQLDYYSSKNVTTGSYEEAKKQSDYDWWLRSPNKNDVTSFYFVTQSGYYINDANSSHNTGVSPAFRIG